MRRLTSPTMTAPFVYVTATSTVEEVLLRFPSTAPIFHLLGLDTCCRANMPLSQAAAHAQTDLGVLLSMLEASVCASFVGSGSR
jgi:iron-sulfur cluster repair protein YtfE (RIC family)